jgi:quinol monooxygenase YgiN
MWAQLIRVRLKAGEDAGLERLYQQLQAAEQPGSGLVRSTLMRDQNDPNALYMLVVFESEEKARARELDPRRDEAMHEVRATMAEIFDGAPQFTDLMVAAEHTG